MICNMTMVDPTTPDSAELAAGIELLCFAPHPEQLPHLQRPGDIIRLHRVKVRFGVPYAVEACLVSSHPLRRSYCPS
jgi:hypothetical protein